MSIEERAERAVTLKNSGGCNCCQAVLFALQDQSGLSDEQARTLGSGFGAGMGAMEGSCGALIAAVMTAGLRGGTQRTAKQISLAFRDACGAVTCKELKGIGTGRVLCSCDNCVRNAVLIYGRTVGLN